MAGTVIGSREVLRRLRTLQLISGLLAVIMVVVGGDLLTPILDRKLGVLASDLIEAVFVSLILYLAGRPQMRELERSIIELDALRERFYAESIHDALSGLYNRRYFDERLAEEFERARRYGHPLALTLIDVDHFKSINDELGHSAGDAAIVAIARALSQRRRRGDVLARIGGEEFAVLLPNLNRSSALTFADGVRRMIASETFELPSAGGRSERRITISCGITELTLDDQFDSALLKRADEALYEAKISRNTVVAR